MPLNPHLAFDQNNSMWEEGVTITQPPNSHVKCLNFKFSTHLEDFKLNLLLKREKNFPFPWKILPPENASLLVTSNFHIFGEFESYHASLMIKILGQI